MLSALVNRATTEVSNAELYRQFKADPQNKGDKDAPGELVRNMGCKPLFRSRWRGDGYTLPASLGQVPDEG